MQALQKKNFLCLIEDLDYCVWQHKLLGFQYTKNISSAPPREKNYWNVNDELKMN